MDKSSVIKNNSFAAFIKKRHLTLHKEGVVFSIYFVITTLLFHNRIEEVGNVGVYFGAVEFV